MGAEKKELVEGLRDAIAYSSGDETKGRMTTVNVPKDVDVKAIRERLGYSQEEFAIRFGFSIGTLRHWEQGQRNPEGPARAYLKVIRYEAPAVERALAVG